MLSLSQTQLLRGPRCGFAAACLQGFWARILPGARMFVSFECFVLLGRGFCVELITHPEGSYRLWRAV